MGQFPGEDVSFIIEQPRRQEGRRRSSRATAIPGAFYLYDADTKKLSFLLAQARHGSKPEAHWRPWSRSRSRRVTAWPCTAILTKPAGKEEAKNLPMVVFVHGGPYGVRDIWDYDPIVQALASRGYAVLQVNFRGSGGYG